MGWLADLKVNKILRADVTLIGRATPLLQLRDLVPLGSRSTVFAVDEGGRYVGAIDVSAVHDPELDDAANVLVAGRPDRRSRSLPSPRNGCAQRAVPLRGK